MTLYTPTQSLIGLLTTLKQKEASKEVMLDVVRWHEYGVQRFIGRVRKCQRLFMAHVVGVADATAHFVTTDRDILAAAMFHSIYKLGRFPMPYRMRREEVRSIVGDKAERMIMAIQSARSDKEDFLSDIENKFGRELVGALLAHEYEEFLMSPPLPDSRRARDKNYLPKLSAHAATYHYEALAKALDDLSQQQEDVSWMASLLNETQGRQLLPEVSRLEKIGYMVGRLKGHNARPIAQSRQR